MKRRLKNFAFLGMFLLRVSVEDLYQALGVSKTATADEIKKAYREAAFKYHPDRNAGDKAAEDKFKTINAAYAVLGDEAKRRDYDRWGSADAYANAWRGQGSQAGESGDPFWDWFNSMRKETDDGGAYTYTWYGPFGTQRGGQNRESEPKQTKSEAFMSLIRSVLSLGIGLVLFRFSLYFLPVAILFIGMMISGVNGIIRSLKRLFQAES
jgi:molecular chaperone DnaJ